MNVPNNRLSAVLGMALLLAGCASPALRSPVSGLMVTDDYSRSLAANVEKIAAGYDGLIEPSWQQRPWWEHYGSAELNALVDEALANNPGIAQTRVRLEQAAATARRSLSDLLPDAAISGERSTQNGDGERPSEFSLTGAASYELDVFGGNKAAYRSSRISAEASAADVQAAAITLSASIVENWLRLLSLREEEALLRSQIETNDMIMNLQHKRYANGVAAALDVLQQQEVVARAQAQLPDVLSAQEIVQHQLAILTGHTPSAPPRISGNRLPRILLIPDSGVPAELLQARPDINAAWLRVRSADWAAESARVERLPSLDISAAYSTSSAKFGGLFETWLLNLALGLVAPVFDGGERAAEQARQEALADERFQAYRATVLDAIGEVEDALTLNFHQAQKIVAVEQQLEASRNSLEQAQISYSNGSTDYVSVLNSLIGTQSLEQQLVRERLELALNRVTLYRALGLRTWHGRDVQMIQTQGK